MKISVDRSRCMCVGNCVEVAPEVFDQDDDGLVVLLQTEVEDGAAVTEAADLCPVQAILLG